MDASIRTVPRGPHDKEGASGMLIPSGRAAVKS